MFFFCRKTNLQNKWGIDINFTLNLIDDKGNPLDNLPVCIWFLHTDQEDVFIKINKKGVAKWSGNTVYGIGYRADKSNYYFSGRSKKIPLERVMQGPVFSSERIKNYNLTDTIILYPIKNQVPLWYLERSISTIQGEDQPKIQFDLLKGDWLPPYGKEEIADVETIGENHPWNTNVTFFNPGDGIQRARKTSNPNEQVPTYDASDTGYKSKLSLTLYDHIYYFRIRANNGKGGFYGKTMVKYSGMTYFEYFINPREGERNLEPEWRRTCTIGEPWKPYEQGAKSNLRIKVLGHLDKPAPGVECILEFLPDTRYAPQDPYEFITQEDSITPPYQDWVYDKVKVTVYHSDHNYTDEIIIQYPDTLRYDAQGNKVWTPWNEMIVLRPSPKIKPISFKYLNVYDYLTVLPGSPLP